MSYRSARPSLTLFAAALAALIFAVLAGCQTQPAAKAGISAPSPQLIQSAPLVLDDECDATGSFVVEFTILKDGRTAAIQTPSSPPCVRQALTAWVGSFRYSPSAREMPGSIEWMLVSARRGS